MKEIKENKKANIIRHFSTVGLRAYIPDIETTKLIRICHDKLDNETWNVYVISGHNLSIIKSCGTFNIAHEEMQDFFCDDKIQEFENLASLFGISICK